MNSHYILINTAKFNAMQQVPGSQQMKSLRKNRELKKSLANGRKSMLSSHKSGGTRVDSSVEFVKHLETSILSSNAPQPVGSGVYAPVVAEPSSYHDIRFNLPSTERDHHESSSNFQSKKSFAEEQLEKRVKQVFGIAQPRPRTSMTRQEFHSKYEIDENTIKKRQQQMDSNNFLKMEESRNSLQPNESVVLFS